jgi:hypothetical protein
MEQTKEGKFKCSWLFDEEEKENPAQTHYVYQVFYFIHLILCCFLF